MLSLRQLLAGNHHLRQADPEPDHDVQVVGGDGDFANLWQIAGDP